MKNIFFATALGGLLISSSLSAGPGYVSRDCPVAGAKESITLDWSDKKHYFYTLSYHVRKKSTSPYYSWEKHYHDDKNGNEINQVLYTDKSYAGQVGNWLKNYYYSGVYGVHYWYNSNARRFESRRRYVTDCNLPLNWGYNNW